jgi:hypothetical protein
MTDAPETFIQSREPADNGYGQNGAQNASSDLPGKHTTSGFLPQVSVPDTKWQTRQVDASPIAATHSMKGASAGVKISGALNHAPKK